MVGTNDFYADAIALPDAASGSVPFDNLNATLEPGEPPKVDENGDPVGGQASPSSFSVWFTWQLPVAPERKIWRVTVDTLGTLLGSLAGPEDWVDTTLELFTGASLPTLVVVAANDDAPYALRGDGNYNSLVEHDLPGGALLTIRVSGFDTENYSHTEFGTLNYSRTPVHDPAFPDYEPQPEPEPEVGEDVTKLARGTTVTRASAGFLRPRPMQ